MDQRESVNPSQEDLLAELQALKLANPEMGVKSLRAAVKGKNPTWIVSEARVKKITFEAGLLPAASEKPLADAFQQQQQQQQMQFQQQQLQFQQQQMRQMQDLTASIQMTMKIMSENQEKQRQQMQELTSAMTTTMKSVSEKLTLVESGLRGLAETSCETSVDKLQSLEEFKVSSLIDRGNPLPSSDIRTAASVSIQQPTVAQIQTAPSSEVAGQKGLTDGGFVNVSKQAIICSSNSAIHVLRTTAPSGADKVSHTLAVVVPETEKLNPASYSEFTIREPGRPEIRVPVLPRPDIRCPHAFKLFDPLSNKEISGKVTLTNVDRPDQPPFILRVPGDELKLSDLKEGKYTMKIEAEGRNAVIVERVVAFGPRRDRSRDLILNLVMEKFDLSLRSTFSEGTQLRAVLQWRDQPRDIDLHLLSFNCRTWKQVTHCYYRTKGSKLGLQHGECLHLDRDDTAGNGCETLTLGQDGGEGVPSMNKEHVYVWMVHQFSSEAPRCGGMKGQFMSVAFSGVKNCVFTGDSDAQISGPENSRWWLVATAKFDQKEGWKFHQLNKLLPLAETGPGEDPNVTGILPHIQRT